jgi:hypothetical protein
MSAGILVEASPPPWLTGRNREDGHNLRDTYLPTNAGEVLEAYKQTHGPISVFQEDCKFGPTCVAWFNWRAYIYSNPHRLPDDFFGMVFPHEGRMFGINDSSDVVLRGQEALANALAVSRKQTFAHPVESPSARRSSGEFREFAVLPESFSRQASVGVLRLTNKGPQLEGRIVRASGAAGEDFGALAENAPVESTQVEEDSAGSFTDYRAILSTSMNAVFVAGGRNGPGSNPHVWAYDLDTKSWNLALRNASPAPTGDVLSMSLDTARGWLYVLFRSDPKWVQLVRYDLKNDTGHKLASWPDLKVFRGVYLNVLDDGTLVMTASKSNSHAAFAFDVSKKGLKFVGGQAGAKAIPFAPQLGSDGLIWPLVNSKDEVSFKTVKRSSFKAGLPCSAL